MPTDKIAKIYKTIMQTSRRGILRWVVMLAPKSMDDDRLAASATRLVHPSLRTNFLTSNRLMDSNPAFGKNY
jgi:hypothetical protein